MHRLTDTSPEVQALEISALQELGLSGRARRAVELARRARDLVEEGVRLRHPEWPPERVQREVVRLAFGVPPRSPSHDP